MIGSGSRSWRSPSFTNVGLVQDRLVDERRNDLRIRNGRVVRDMPQVPSLPFQHPSRIIEQRSFVEQEIYSSRRHGDGAQPVVPVAVDGEGKPAPLDRHVNLLYRPPDEVGQPLHFVLLI